MFSQTSRVRICGGSLLFVLGMLAACSSTVDRAHAVRRMLDAAGLHSVSVSEDGDKGVMTLNGNVPSEADKAKADSIAKSLAGPQVVSNQIAVVPPGFEKQARQINADLDKAIGQNLDAALILQNLRKGVNYAVKNGVVTLTGDVSSQQMRSGIQNIASRIPNVQQVVNEMQVKNQKASSTN